MKIVPEGGAGSLWLMRVSLRKHTAFLHGPRCEFYAYHYVFAFLEEGGLSDGRGRGRERKFGWRRDVLSFVGNGRGDRTGFGP